MNRLLRLLRAPAKRVDRFFHRLFSAESDPAANPLFGERCIEYAFVVRQLVAFDRRKIILDVGSSGSPLTTIIRSLGFERVYGIDLLVSPLRYEGITFYQGDFLSIDEPDSSYDIVIFCSSIEHFGLVGRFGSPSAQDGDLKALQKAHELLRSSGILILTVPYGTEKVIWPLHRVYNRESRFFKEALQRFRQLTEEYYRNDTSNTWVKCTESEARLVIPKADNYALGLFVFSKR